VIGEFGYSQVPCLGRTRYTQRTGKVTAALPPDIWGGLGDLVAGPKGMLATKRQSSGCASLSQDPATTDIRSPDHKARYPPPNLTVTWLEQF
jgi:hypothetical protein